MGKTSVGAILFGYRLCADGKMLEEDTGELATIAKARRLRQQRRSLRAMGSEHAISGCYARNGKVFEARFGRCSRGRRGDDFPQVLTPPATMSS
jgi:hypothetical protein